MEAVACQRVLAVQDLDPPHFRHDNHGASHSAVGASAAADGIEAVAESHLETHRTAMAPTSPNVRVACHVAWTSCSDHASPVLCAMGKHGLRPPFPNGQVVYSSRQLCQDAII